MTKSTNNTARPRGRPRSFDREAALERAVEVFWTHGYEATSLNDLTSAMGINPPSLYAAFGDKEKLFMEAVDRYQQERLASITRAFDEEPTARRAIERLLMEGASALARHGVPRGCLLVMSDANCSNESRHVQEALAKRRSQMTALLKARIDRGVREGDVAPGTDTAALADFYSIVMQGMVMLARDRPSRKALSAAVNAAMRAWPASRAATPKSRRATQAEASPHGMRAKRRRSPRRAAARPPAR
jgi:AcrR family transcriptional regulator